MASLLSTGTKRRASPAYCKKGMWGLIPPLIAGKPVRLAVFARWTEKAYGLNIELIESFQLSYNAGTGDWTGASGDQGENLAVEICSLVEKDRYDVELIFRQGTTQTNQHLWANQHIPDVRPFDTGSLQHDINFPFWYYQLHAKG